MYTKQSIIETAKQSSWNIMGTFIPSIEQHWIDFAEQAGIDFERYYNLEKYIQVVSYAEKRNVFERLGFKVLFLTLSASKVSNFVTDHTNGQNGKSLNQQFLDGERNLIIVDVTVGTKSLYFVLEYLDANDKPLCDYTVDRDEVKRQEERSAAAKNWMDSIRAKRKAKEASGESDPTDFPL